METSSKPVRARHGSGDSGRVHLLEDQAQLGGKRAYTTDFEVYDQRARNPQDSQIDIYVGVK